MRDHTLSALSNIWIVASVEMEVCNKELKTLGALKKVFNLRSEFVWGSAKL